MNELLKLPDLKHHYGFLPCQFCTSTLTYIPQGFNFSCHLCFVALYLSHIPLVISEGQVIILVIDHTQILILVDFHSYVAELLIKFNFYWSYPYEVQVLAEAGMIIGACLYVYRCGLSQAVGEEGCEFQSVVLSFFFTPKHVKFWTFSYRCS